MANHLVARLLRLLLLWALLLMLWLSLGATSNVAAFLAPLSSSSTATSTRSIPGGGLVEGRGSHLAADTSQQHEFALLFDCDGVILETEELHRLAYNHAFREFDLTIDGEPVVWSVRTSCYVLLGWKPSEMLGATILMMLVMWCEPPAVSAMEATTHPHSRSSSSPS